MKHSYLLAFFLLTAFAFSGCAGFEKLEKENTAQKRSISQLNEEISKLNQELNQLTHSQEDLEAAKAALEGKLRAELSAGDLTLTLKERGLVISVLNKILFKSGMATLKDSAKGTLQKVAVTLKEVVPDNMVYTEGHTDNVPIARSGWKSNWELSTARSTEVVHFLIAEGVSPSRLAACGYGEYQPMADNTTIAGRQKNRRVEIIVSPKRLEELLPQKKIT